MFNTKNSINFIICIIFTAISGCSKQNLPEDNSVILGGSLYVYKEDLGKLNFTDATNACKKLGTGWRLAESDEFIILCNNKDKIPNLVNNGKYWTSSPGPQNEGNYRTISTGCSPGRSLLTELLYVRPVKNK